MYSGARTQLGDSASPFAIPNIGIDASQKAIQRGAVTLDETVKQYFKIQDFGEEQRLESEVRGLQNKFDVEFQRRASLAPGSSPQALYDSDGTLRESVLQDLSDDFANQVGELRGGFVLPESRMKSDAMRQRVGEDFINKAYQKAALLGIQRTRQAFEEGLKGDLLRKDYVTARERYAQARQSGLITETAMNSGIFQVDQADAIGRFDNLAATNPDLAAEMINRGELDGLFSAAEQEKMMHSLRRQDDSRLTELIDQAVSQPRGKDNRQAMASALLAGSPYKDELKFLSIYNRDQSFAACMPEIENFLHRLADDVAPGEEKNVLESKMTDLSRKCTFYQMPSDTKSRLLKRMEENAKRRAEYPKLNAVDYIRNATAGRNVKLYDPALYNERIGSLNQAANSTYALVKDSYKNAGFSVPDRAKWGEKYAHDSINALEDELTNQTISKVRVAFDSWHNAYKQDHGDKEPSITIQEDKLETLLRQYTGNQNFSLPGKFGMEADNVVNEANKAAKDAYLQRKESAPKLADDQAKERFIPQKTFTFPATVSVDTVQTNAPAGILLPESMRKRFGDDLSHVAALVPVSSSSRRGRPLPIVGFTKASSPQLTLAGASKLRMTFSSRMNTHVSIVPAGKEMQEFFKREFFNQPSGDSEAPPLDYGLVPDNGVETAEPVSGAYLNGELTMLPSLN